MPIETVSRQRYTNPDVAGGECAPRGQDIDRDFTTYHDVADRVGRAGVVGPGVVVGFELTSADGGKVAVRSGVAVAASGRLVVLADAGPAFVGDDPTAVALPVLLTPPGAGEFVLTAAVAQVPVDGERCGRMAWATRLRLTPVAAFAASPDAVVLGFVIASANPAVPVQLDESGSLVGVVRQRVTLSGGGVVLVRADVDGDAPAGAIRADPLGGLRVEVAQSDRGVSFVPAAGVHFDSFIVQANDAMFTGALIVNGPVTIQGRTIPDDRQKLDDHIASTANPHQTTAAQVGALPTTGGQVSGRVDFGQPAPVGGPIGLLFRERGVAVHNRDGLRVAGLSTSERVVAVGGLRPPGSGSLTLAGSAGKLGVHAFVGTAGGRIEVYDASGNLRSALDGSGVKPFIMPHPNDPGRQIIYAAIEGPEAAAYVRGRAALVGGSAAVAYPEHFALVVNPDTVTVTLTPRSAASKGLAVTASDAAGFRVQELAGGTGSYEFDFLAVGVRKGYEHYQPVVGVGESHFGERVAADLDPDPETDIG